MEQEWDNWNDSDPAYSAFSQDITNRPVLTEAQELQLGQRIQAAQTPEEELALRNELAEHNLRLVISVSKHFFPPHPFTEHDLIQEGNLGLIHASRHWNPQDYNNTFSTYATRCIAGYINIAIRHTLPYSKDMAKRIKAFRKHEQLLAQDLVTTEVPPEEVLNSMGIFCPETRRAITQAQTFAPQPSLHNPINDHPDSDIHLEFVSDTQPPAPHQAEQHILKREIDHLLSSSDVHQLTAREQMILARRYGCNGHLPHLYREIGEKLGYIGHQRATQITKEALQKLRDNLPEDTLETLRDFYDAS